MTVNIYIWMCYFTNTVVYVVCKARLFIIDINSPCCVHTDFTLSSLLLVTYPFSISQQMWPFLVRHDFAKWHCFNLILSPGTLIALPPRHIPSNKYPFRYWEVSVHKLNSVPTYKTLGSGASQLLIRKQTFPFWTSRCHSLNTLLCNAEVFSLESISYSRN